VGKMSNSLIRQIKRNQIKKGETMNDKKPIPMMRVPKISGQPGQQQINIDPSDVIFKDCIKCGHQLYDMAYRYGIVSALSTKNPTGKDIPLKTEALICRFCGQELGKEVPEKQ